MKTWFLLTGLLMGANAISAQDVAKDSTLKEVVIQAYAADRPALTVPASVGFVDQELLDRFANTSLLPAVNVIPGVRMEERSPGSYRFSIRGSSIRSPFGVRNVKFYWNGMPLTDAGGNTYLNIIDFANIGSMEIIKGPGGSLYGAGTGGVVLLQSPATLKNEVSVSSVVGSFGLQRYQLSGSIQREKVSASIQLSSQRSDGYRKHSEMERPSFFGQVRWRIGSDTYLNTMVLYSDLFYQTPGGLTKAQFEADPTQARPATPAIRSAEQQKAAVTNKTLYGGVSLEHGFSDKINTTTSIYFSSTDFENPAIRNWEERDEQNTGFRHTTTFQANKVKINVGGELQYGRSAIQVYENNFGVRGLLQEDNDLTSFTSLLFAQADWTLGKTWYITLGGSVNFNKVNYDRVLPETVEASRTFDPFFAPRVAVLKKFNDLLSIYGSVSRGFSQPTIAELYPSRQIFDRNLDPENGLNFELGLKGRNKRFGYEITWYRLTLNDAIVVRRDAALPGEPEYFVNAGSTRQPGVEAMIDYTFLRRDAGLFRLIRAFATYAYTDYVYEDYVLNGTDYSGNEITGVPPVTVSAGADADFGSGLYWRTTVQFVDHLPVNDDNSVYAQPYLLLGSRFGWKFQRENLSGELFVGGDNLLDKTYSLGNDLNAVGGRFYNAAATRNYFFGVRIAVGK